MVHFYFKLILLIVIGIFQISIKGDNSNKSADKGKKPDF